MLKRKTTVTIESHRGILRLRWNDSSPKRRSLNLHLPDSPATRALAKKKKLWIEQDYQEGEAVYDRTLAKYEESNSDSGSINLTASELFEAFAQHQAKDKSLAQSSIDARYKPVAVALKKVFPDLLVCEIDKEQVEKFVTHCQKTLQTAGVYRERTILKRRKAEVKPRNGTDLLFTTPTGLPIDIRNFRARAWKKTLEAVGVDYKKPYKMRGTAELFAIASGQNYVAVAAAFGHKPEVAHAHYIDVPVFYEFDYQKLPPIIKKSTS